MEQKNNEIQFNKPSTRDSEHIIRQSQLERAIELFKLFEVKPTLREVLRLSQLLTDFQYNWNLNSYHLIKFEQHFQQKPNESLLNEAPHIRTGVSQYQQSVSKKLKS